MKISFLGDSLTLGYPFSEDFSWANIISQQLNLKMTNHGVCGETTADFVARMNWVLVDEDITHLVIFGGFNDIGEHRPLKYIITDLKRCAHPATAKGISVAYVLPYLPSDHFYLQQAILLRTELKKTFANTKNVLIDLQPPGVMHNVITDLDGLHPTIEGYQLLAQTALPQIKAWLKI